MTALVREGLACVAPTHTTRVTRGPRERFFPPRACRIDCLGRHCCGQRRGPRTMKIHRLYADKSGESHFETVEIALTESSRAGRLSERMPATGVIFREVMPDYDLDWHPAPRRQYIVNLDAGV